MNVNYFFYFRETFHALAWSTIDLGDEKRNILASGGILGEIRLYDPKALVNENIVQVLFFDFFG